MRVTSVNNRGFFTSISLVVNSMVCNVGLKYVHKYPMRNVFLLEF